MTATRFNPDISSRQGRREAGGRRPQFGEGSASALGLKWQALHDVGATIAKIAKAESEPMTPEVRHFPAAIRDAGGWRRETAEQGIEDIAAMLEPGLTALLASAERGGNPEVPARVLWQEFIGARNALLTLSRPRD